ncbi:16S rRNA (cytidine1402-2'-O)-methyltransferase [Geosporobacter subterraneus DSM 17957]|uniref:Ribosomal RNA small subunit methyltransferase I n=1 Tax=Geosporobacter subterraneus DSM 17957 TaxID=1121919 RepID=A0A1M6PSA0_9FIRM|nr:16S rRNA (cytidine(1402)-2'-O)-methyltransferase [Geosporobacter subterraneus]SHK10748.1 16S rRNA (cytidine1402-2'-O)-methyltransferase [Geosporobacter subterraneus DSM 17957]
MTKDCGKLYICPTPIGNLEDITLRVLRILKEVDLIAAEDTRHTIKLLNHYDIQKPLTSYHEHNRESKGKVLLEKLMAGENIALVSDAGMPGISDPGSDLVKLCVENHIDIEVLPGAAAFVTALVASGLPTDKFSFEGFLDRDKKKRKKRLEEIKGEDRTLIFYEAPHRICTTLQDIVKVLGNRQAVLARELTKKHEEFLRGSLEELEAHFEQREPKGEMVLMISGAAPEDRLQEISSWESLSIEAHLTQYMDSGMDKKEAIKAVAKERGIPKREVYECSIHLE